MVVIKNRNLHFLDGGSIESMSNSSSDDGAWKNQIFKDSIMNSSQGSASGSHLRSMELAPLGLNGSLGNKEDRVLKFLFKLGNKSSVDFLEELEAGNWDEDKNEVLSLLSLNDGFNFLGIGNEEVLEVILQLSAAIFNIKESLSNSLLEGSGVFLKDVKT